MTILGKRNCGVQRGKAKVNPGNRCQTFISNWYPRAMSDIILTRTARYLHVEIGNDGHPKSYKDY